LISAVGLLETFRKPMEPRSIVGDGMMLRFPAMEDYGAWASLRAESRSFLEPWEPTWPTDDLALPAYRYRIRRYRELAAEDTCYPYFIFNRERVLLGAVSLTNLRRGVAQTATLGYWIGAQHARQGHMSRALELLVPHAFKELSLHRLEAACLPHNKGSIRLLQKARFEKEGFAKSYLQIAGRWEDHLLFARVAG
jgi:[ribosomal protein S5]-alanine N-acetyltransferase